MFYNSIKIKFIKGVINLKKIGICAVLLGLICVGCASNYMGSFYSKDSEIASDNNSFNLNTSEQALDETGYTGKLEFEGMDTVWKYDADKDTEVEIGYLLSVDEGKAKLVLISPTGKIQTIVENIEATKQKELQTIKIKVEKGINRIKLVAADKAKIEMKLQASQGKLDDVGF